MLPFEAYRYDAVYFILLTLCFAWGGDTAAYFAGRAFGKRKLAPVVSPHKTVEGALGGVAGSIAAGVLLTAAYGGLSAQYPVISIQIRPQHYLLLVLMYKPPRRFVFCIFICLRSSKRYIDLTKNEHPVQGARMFYKARLMRPIFFAAAVRSYRRMSAAFLLATLLLRSSVNSSTSPASSATPKGSRRMVVASASLPKRMGVKVMPQ